MDQDVKHEAALVAEKVGPGLARHQPAAYNALFDEVSAEQLKRSPAQFKEFTAELSKDLAGPLRGVKIEGMEREDKWPPRLLMHTDVSTDKFSKYDLPRMTDYLIHNWVRKDGVSVQAYGDGGDLAKKVGDTLYGREISRSVADYNHYSISRPGMVKWTYPDGHYAMDTCDKNGVLTQVGKGSKAEDNFKRVYPDKDICDHLGK